MKNYTFKLSIVGLIFFSIGFFLACTTQDSLPYQPTNKSLIFDLSADEPLKINKIQEGHWLIENEVDANDFFNRKFPEIGKRIAGFSDFQINVNPQTNEIASITAMGIDENGKNIPVGMNILPMARDSRLKSYRKVEFSELDNLNFTTGTTHTCTGDPCSCCEFVKNSSGEITGCKCKGQGYGDCAFQYNQKCNHSIGSSQ